MALLWPTMACATPDVAPTSDLALLDMSTGAAATVVPDTREGFLAVLAPLPSDAVRVTYDVAGPGGLSGELEILLLPGGRRREAWLLELPLPDGATHRIESSAVQTEDYAWVGTGGDLEIERSPLGALADAYLGLPQSERRAVVESLDSFRLRIASARKNVASPDREILGVPCLATRLAAQDLCVWEETGLPLDYRGNAFSLRAREIVIDAPVPDDAFEVSAEVKREAPGPDMDPHESLRRLARQDYAELGPLLHPGLRLPLG